MSCCRDKSPELFHERVRTRGQCLGGLRPCPFVSCKWHLYLDIIRYHKIKINHESEGEEDIADVLLRMPETCALDVADRGPHTLNDIGIYMGLTRERIRQIEAKAIRKLQHPVRARKLEGFLDHKTAS